MNRWSFVVLAVATCTPTPAPVAPPVVDASDAGCAFEDKINASRLIRTSDGSALWIPCDAGSSQ